jgi:hypothetical protein
LEARLFMPSAKRQLEPASAPPSVGRGDLQSLLGPAPLLEGEDADAYALYGHIRASVEPKDAIGEIWVRGVGRVERAISTAWVVRRASRIRD